MCGCWRLAVVVISARNRCAPITADSSGRSTLSATLRRCFRSSARYTVAIPPAPSSRSMRYRSARAAVNRSTVSFIAGASLRRLTATELVEPVLHHDDANAGGHDRFGECDTSRRAVDVPPGAKARRLQNPLARADDEWIARPHMP